MKGLAASTIHKATIIKGMLDLKEAGIEKATTAEIGEHLLRPQNYDMGARLHVLATATQPLIDKEKAETGGNNVYFVTPLGEEFLQKNMRHVQTYGEYELSGEDKVQAPITSGAALAALTELQTLIDSNVKVKTFINKIYYEIDAFIKELDADE